MNNWIRKKLGISDLQETISNVEKSAIGNEISLQKISEKINYSKTEIEKGLSNVVSILSVKKEIFAPEAFHLRGENNLAAVSFNLKNDFDISRFKVNGKAITNFSLLGAAAASIGSFSQIADGLYYCSTASSTLMQIGSGYGSAIMGSGGIVGQTSFIPASLGAFTPVLIFQAAAMLTINNRLNQIEEELQKIQGKLEVLIAYHESEMQGNLLYINKSIQRLVEQNSYTSEDFMLLEDFKYKLNVLKYQYDHFISKSLDEILGYNFQSEETKDASFETSSNDGNPDSIPLKKGEKIKNNVFDKTNSLFRRTGNALKSWTISKFIDDHFIERLRNSSGNVKDLMKRVETTKFFYYTSLSAFSEYLLHYCDFVEIKMNLAVINPDENRVIKTNDLISKFENSTSENNFNQLQTTEKFEMTILPVIEEKLEKSDWSKTEINLLKKQISNQINGTKDFIQKGIYEIENIQKEYRKDQNLEIAIEVKNGTETIFMLNN